MQNLFCGMGIQLSRFSEGRKRPSTIYRRNWEKRKNEMTEMWIFSFVKDNQASGVYPGPDLKKGEKMSDRCLIG